MNEYQGREIRAPWRNPRPQYPPPSAALLRAHFSTSVWSSLQDGAEAEELDEESSDDEADVSERVKTWLYNIWEGLDLPEG